MRQPLIWLSTFLGAAILGIAIWSSWPLSERGDIAPKIRRSPVQADDLDVFVADIRGIARAYMADVPELRESVMKFTAALGVDAVAAEIADQRRVAEADIANVRDEERMLRRRVDELAGEVARLERIAGVQRQLVADVMNEWTATQERNNPYADAKNFWLSVVANWVSGIIIFSAPWLLGRRTTPPDQSIRRLRRE